MNNLEIRIAFIIPTYNRHKQLDLTLKQLKIIFEKLHNYDYFSHIKPYIYISDNASSDRTNEIIKKYFNKQNTNILYKKRKENLGPILNHLFALHEMKDYEFLSIWGDDDDIEFNFIEEIFYFISRNKKDEVLMQAPILLNKKYNRFSKEILSWYSSFSIPGLTFNSGLIKYWPNSSTLKYPQTLFITEILLNKIDIKLIPKRSFKSRKITVSTYTRLSERGSLDYCFTERISYFMIFISYERNIKKANFLKKKALKIITPEITFMLVDLLNTKRYINAIKSLFFILDNNCFSFGQKFFIINLVLRGFLKKKIFNLFNKKN